MPITTTDLAYVAAVVDTMANLRERTSSASPLPEVQVNCANLPLLAWLEAVTGAKHFPTDREYTRHRCAQHCVEPHQHVRSRSGRWSVTGARATVLLHNVHPYLRLRADEAAALIQLGLAAGWKSNAVEGMLALGWTLPPFKAQARARADQAWKVS